MDAKTRQSFEQLVAACERLSERSPRAYRVRLLLLSLLGYAYIAAVVVLLLGSAAAIGWVLLSLGGTYAAIKLALPLAGLAWIIVVALRVPVRPPDGIRLSRRNEPALFNAIEEIRRRVGAPPPDTVVLTSELNASVVQLSRFGPFGQRNHLVLGWPLMQALDEAQFRAVLAHEFGHFAANHGRLAVWVYGVRMRWSQLLWGLEQADHWGGVLFRRFFLWYVPYFDAYSLVAARAHEYTADEAAAQAESADALACGLARLAVLHRLLDVRFLPAWYRRVTDEAEPPAHLYSTMEAALRNGYDDPAAAAWLDLALRGDTAADDTHPCLSDRLQALGMRPPSDATHWLKALRPRPDETSAAAALLLENDGYMAALDANWLDELRPAWQERHAQITGMRKELERLEAPDAPLSLAQSQQHVSLLLEVHGAERALPAARTLAERHPESASARLQLGSVLAALEDAEALDHIEWAMRADEGLVLAGLDIGRRLLRGLGRNADALAFQHRWDDVARRSAELAWSRQSTVEHPLPVSVPGEALRVRHFRITRSRFETSVLRRKPVTITIAREAIIVTRARRQSSMRWTDVARAGVVRGAVVMRGRSLRSRLRVRVPDTMMADVVEAVIAALTAAGKGTEVQDDAIVSARPVIRTFRRHWWAWPVNLAVPLALLVPGAFVHPGLYLLGVILLALGGLKLALGVYRVVVDMDAIRAISPVRTTIISLRAITDAALVLRSDGEIVVALQNAHGGVITLPSVDGDSAGLFEAIWRNYTRPLATSGVSTGPARSRSALPALAVLAVAALIGVIILPIRSGLALSEAARFGHLPTIEGLLALGAPLDGRGVEGRTAVYQAAKFGHLHVVQALTGRGASLQLGGTHLDFSPLHVAAERNHAEVVSYLLDARIPVDVENNIGQSPLDQLARGRGVDNVNTARVLLEHGASLGRRRHDGDTPFHAAVNARNIPLVELFVAHGADLEAPDGDALTPLHIAAGNDDVAMVDRLVRLGATVDVPAGRVGRTALGYAARFGKADAVRALIALGARIDMVDRENYRPMDLAAWLGHAGVVSVLLEAGASPDGYAASIGHPLHVAAWFGHVEVVRTLLDHGVDPQLATNGRTTLSIARETQRTAVVRLLQERGARD